MFFVIASGWWNNKKKGKKEKQKKNVSETTDVLLFGGWACSEINRPNGSWTAKIAMPSNRRSELVIIAFAGWCFRLFPDQKDASRTSVTFRLANQRFWRKLPGGDALRPRF